MVLNVLIRMAGLFTRMNSTLVIVACSAAWCKILTLVKPKPPYLILFAFLCVLNREFSLN